MRRPFIIENMGCDLSIANESSFGDGVVGCVVDI